MATSPFQSTLFWRLQSSTGRKSGLHSYGKEPIPIDALLEAGIKYQPEKYGKEPIPINALLEAGIKYQLDKYGKEPIPVDACLEADIKYQLDKYGKEPIPINALLEADIKYQLDKCFELVGFVDSSTIPRYHLVGDPSLVLAVLEEGSQKGLSALVRAMERGNKAAVARIVQRANSAVKLVLLTPNLGTLTIPDSMIMSTLPLAEDIRTFTFPPLTKNLPTAQQASAADELVRSLDLTQSSSGREMLQPETTFNPHLQHWYYQLGVKALNPNADMGVNCQGPESE
eukprot:gene31036-7128_t